MSASPGEPEGAGREGAEPEPEGGSSPLIILAVVIGVGLLYWLGTSFVDWNKTQACATVGKRDCGPAIELNQK